MSFQQLSRVHHSICSAEALPVARLIHSGLQHDDFDVILWSEGVFKATNYTLQTLEDEVDQADFAIAVAYGDDGAGAAVSDECALSSLVPYILLGYDDT